MTSVITIAIALAAVTAALAGRRRILGPSRLATPCDGPSVGPSLTATRHGEPDESSWAALLDATAAGVRTGASLRVAYATASNQVAISGRSLTQATPLAQVPMLSSPDPSEAVAIQTISVAIALGGPTATVLERGAALLRERAAVRAEATAHAAQARLSAKVLTAVPLLFAGWSFTASSAFRAAVLSPAGTVAAFGGLLCNGVGWWWMRCIVAKAQR